MVGGKRKFASPVFEEEPANKLRKTKTLDHYNITPARRKMLGSNFTRAESKEEREELANGAHWSTSTQAKMN